MAKTQSPLFEVPVFGPWEQYDLRERTDLPGVYLLAHMASVPAGPGDPLSSDVIYIGETTGQTLEKRLYQFARSAFSRKSGHSGGWTYSDTFLDGEVAESTPEGLYVALLSVDMEARRAKAYIKAVERVTLWSYTEAHGRYPVCNLA